MAEFFEDSTAEVGEAVAALARHWRDAGDPERAIRYFVQAGEQAERGWAKDQAVILYGEALELVPEGRRRPARPDAPPAGARASRPQSTSRTRGS